MKTARMVLIPLVAALAVTAVVCVGALKRVDKWVQDTLFQKRGVTSRDIVIFGIDDASFDLFGPYNTWTRDVMAMALEKLASDPDNLPAVVAVDVIYTGASASADADARLAAAADRLGNVICAGLGDVDEYTGKVLGIYRPYEALGDAASTGCINTMVDADGVTRHAVLYLEAQEGRMTSMAWQAASMYAESQGNSLGLPDDIGPYSYISFSGMPEDYSDDVSIASLIMGQVPSAYWAGKIVLIGPWAAALGDAYFTPIDKGRPMYGVEIQANVIQCLLEGRMKREIGDTPQLIALLVLCIILMALFLRLRVLPGAALCMGAAGLGVALPMLLYNAGYVTHPLWLGACALALYVISLGLHYARASRERHQLALEKERIDAELNLAASIQANSLPKQFPPFPERHEFELYASMTPAREVGGDFYDFFLIDEDHLGMVIADVSGKGVPAALFMMVSKVLVHNAAMSNADPGKALELANRQLCANNPEGMFVTVWLGVLEISTGRLVSANAGHEIPVLKASGGDFELLKSKHGFVLGGMEGMRYRNIETQLQPGAKLFVYTDGVPEATDAHETLFGNDRMIDALRASQEKSPEQILASVKAAVDAFVDSAPQFDDLTMLCLAYKGPGYVSDKDEPA